VTARRPPTDHAARRWIVPALCLAAAGCFDVELEQEPDWSSVLEQDEEDRGTYLIPWPVESVPELRIGITPYLGREQMEADFAPLKEHLQHRIGIPVQMVVAPDYAGLGRMLHGGEIDVGEFTPLSYVLTKLEYPDLQLLLREVSEGADTYVSYVYVRADDPAETLTALGGRSFCYVDPHSTSGYLYPRALLWEHHIDPDRFFGRTVFAGDHVGCLHKVLDGEIDAAAIYSGAVAQARREDLPVFRLKVVAKTRRIPYGAYCARAGLPEAARQRFRNELLQLSERSPEGPRLIGRGAKINAWAPAEDQDYNPVRRAVYLTRMNAHASRPAAEPMTDAPQD